MNFSERNKKVALARWAKVLAKERSLIPFDPETVRLKAALCGFLAGDGSVQKRFREKWYHYDVKFFPDDKIMLRTYCDILKKIYRKTPTITIRDNVFHVVLTSRTVFEDITNMADFGIYKWGLPNKLFSTPGAKEAWLRAFFSAEAYVGPNSIKIQTVNKKGMKAVSNLLIELDIHHGCYTYRPKNPKYSVVDIIVIIRKEARIKFYDKIGFWHSKKTDKLKKSLNL